MNKLTTPITILLLAVTSCEIPKTPSETPVLVPVEGIESITWTQIQSPPSRTYDLVIEAKTSFPNMNFTYLCGSDIYDSFIQIRQQAYLRSEVRDTLRTTCESDVKFRVSTSDKQLLTTYRYQYEEVIPEIMLRLEVPEASVPPVEAFTQMWRDNSILEARSGVLTLEVLTTGSQVWSLGRFSQLEVLSEMSEAIHHRFFVTPSSSYDIVAYSQAFRFGVWTAPPNTSSYNEPIVIPITYNPDLPLSYRIQADTTRIRARVWQSLEEPSEWQIDEPISASEGHFGIGAHSVKERTITKLIVR